MESNEFRKWYIVEKDGAYGYVNIHSTLLHEYIRVGYTLTPTTLEDIEREANELRS